MFSIGGRFYNGATLSYSYMPDRVLENARNVSINLHQRLARFIKLRLFFADRWMMLSEVAFDSGKFHTYFFLNCCSTEIIFPKIKLNQLQLWFKIFHNYWS
jgi:hypothetical protein